MQRLAVTASALTLLFSAVVHADTAPPIKIIDSATPTVELPVKPGVYVGQADLLADELPDGATARIAIWEAGVSKTWLGDYPFTEYVLMISGHVVITNDDGSEMSFRAGDTFVIPRGWSGVWDIRERMKKQMVQVGDLTQRPKAKPLD